MEICIPVRLMSVRVIASPPPTATATYNQVGAPVPVTRERVTVSTPAVRVASWVYCGCKCRSGPEYVSKNTETNVRANPIRGRTVPV